MSVGGCVCVCALLYICIYVCIRYFRHSPPRGPKVRKIPNGSECQEKEALMGDSKGQSLPTCARAAMVGTPVLGFRVWGV